MGRNWRGVKVDGGVSKGVGVVETYLIISSSGTFLLHDCHSGK